MSKKKSRTKLAEAKRRERDRLFWMHGYYAGRIDQMDKGHQVDATASRFAR